MPTHQNRWWQPSAYRPVTLRIPTRSFFSWWRSEKGETQNLSFDDYIKLKGEQYDAEAIQDKTKANMQEIEYELRERGIHFNSLPTHKQSNLERLAKEQATAWVTSNNPEEYNKKTVDIAKAIRALSTRKQRD